MKDLINSVMFAGFVTVLASLVDSTTVYAKTCGGAGAQIAEFFMGESDIIEELDCGPVGKAAGEFWESTNQGFKSNRNPGQGRQACALYGGLGTYMNYIADRNRCWVTLSDQNSSQGWSNYEGYYVAY